MKNPSTLTIFLGKSEKDARFRSKSVFSYIRQNIHQTVLRSRLTISPDITKIQNLQCAITLVETKHFSSIFEMLHGPRTKLFKKSRKMFHVYHSAVPSSNTLSCLPKNKSIATYTSPLSTTSGGSRDPAWGEGGGAVLEVYLIEGWWCRFCRDEATFHWKCTPGASPPLP